MYGIGSDRTDPERTPSHRHNGPRGLTPGRTPRAPDGNQQAHPGLTPGTGESSIAYVRGTVTKPRGVPAPHPLGLPAYSHNTY